MNPVYIISATQISAQEPLSEAWMLAPKKLASGAAPCLDPDFKEFIPPVQARRMGNLLKRALVTAKKALALSGIPMPDAILCGTGLGCMEPTERILATFRESGEGSVSPTDFMQSTHNTHRPWCVPERRIFPWRWFFPPVPGELFASWPMCR